MSKDSVTLDMEKPDRSNSQGISSVRMRHAILPGKAALGAVLLAVFALAALALYRSSGGGRVAPEEGQLGNKLFYDGIMGMFRRPEFDRIMFKVEDTGLEEEALLKRRSAAGRSSAAQKEKAAREWIALDSDSRELLSVAKKSLHALAAAQAPELAYAPMAQALESANKLRDNGRLLSENDGAPSWLGLVYINLGDSISKAIAQYLRQTTGSKPAISREAAARQLAKFADGIEASVSAESVVPPEGGKP